MLMVHRVRSNCTNIDICDHERTSRRGAAACPDLKVRRYLGYGESLCMKHDQEAREERKEEAVLLRKIERLDAVIETAGSFTVWVWRSECALLTERLAILRRKALLTRYRNVTNRLNGHPPVHMRLQQVRRELEREREPTWAGRHPRALRSRSEEAELEGEREREESRQKRVEERDDHRKGAERARHARREAQLRQPSRENPWEEWPRNEKPRKGKRSGESGRE
ncbi:hypothetical protein DL764_004427 [Monosporascus ibericus]|uniref:Uncharacterized protein n=1 Tax=Monosporascus ibericus TaxID=155417 RepID=A0A4Q4TD67_9PEZI|nr:hypothetical protein DL764_004427 [Monosporascus ibericus]